MPAEAKNIADALITLVLSPTAERLPSLLITPENNIEAIIIDCNAALRQKSDRSHVVL